MLTSFSFFSAIYFNRAGCRFLDNRAFIPAFILWIKSKDRQRIVFIAATLIPQKAYKTTKKPAP